MEESKDVQEFKKNAKFKSVGGVSFWQALGIPKKPQREISFANSQKPKNKKRRRAKSRKQQIEFELCEKRTREYLKGFWERFNAEETKENRLVLLKDAANPDWPRVSGKMRSRCRRDKYHKMSILFSGLGEIECASCESIASEKHHIIPCCYGGPTIQENLIMICMGCHNEIHPWLFSQENK